VKAFSWRFSSIISKRDGGVRSKKEALTKRGRIKQKVLEKSATAPRIIKLISVSTYFAVQESKKKSEIY
jgi:hypothetical protein